MTQPGRAQWQRMRSEGLARFVFWNGVVARGVPMALVTMLLLQLLQDELSAAGLGSPKFLGRLLLALLVFGVGGALSAFARWKSMESRYQEGPD